MKLIFPCQLAELMDDQGFQGENLKESIVALGFTLETRTFKLLYKPTQLQSHIIVAVNWMAENENSFRQGGLLADDCSPCNVTLCCAFDILFATQTIIRLWQHWLEYVTWVTSMNKRLRIHLLASTNGRWAWMTITQRLYSVRRSEVCHECYGRKPTSQH